MILGGKLYHCYTHDLDYAFKNNVKSLVFTLSGSHRVRLRYWVGVSFMQREYEKKKCYNSNTYTIEKWYDLKDVPVDNVIKFKCFNDLITCITACGTEYCGRFYNVLAHPQIRWQKTKTVCNDLTDLIDFRNASQIKSARNII